MLNSLGLRFLFCPNTHCQHNINKNMSYPKIILLGYNQFLWNLLFIVGCLMPNPTFLE